MLDNNYISLEPLYKFIEKDLTCAKMIHAESNLNAPRDFNLSEEIVELLNSNEDLNDSPGIMVWCNKTEKEIRIIFIGGSIRLKERIREYLKDLRSFFWFRFLPVEKVKTLYFDEDHYYENRNKSDSIENFDIDVVDMLGANLIFWIKTEEHGRSVVNRLKEIYKLVPNKKVSKTKSDVENVVLKLKEEIDIFFELTKSEKFQFKLPQSALSIFSKEQSAGTSLHHFDKEKSHDQIFEDVKENSKNEFEQLLLSNIVNEEFTDAKKLADKIEELAAKDDVDEMITVNSKQYKRSNYLMALIKKQRRFQCQFCDVEIRKANGDLYVEACHIEPKKSKGKDKPDNILVLCPNHHKLFDFGKREDVNHLKESYSVKLNGKTFYAKLSWACVTPST